MDKYAIASNAKNTPMKGILLKVSGNTVGRPSIALPTKSEPIKPERPVPKIVKARPVATWFVASTKTKNPKILGSAKMSKINVLVKSYKR